MDKLKYHISKMNNDKSIMYIPIRKIKKLSTHDQSHFFFILFTSFPNLEANLRYLIIWKYLSTGESVSLS